MANINLKKYKILIDPDSKKTSGIKVGDVVRRQYEVDGRLIYTLMVVVETGVDVLAKGDSHYFIGVLIEGDVPVAGELLDFIRITSLTETQRSGALYLTASDKDAPYLDVLNHSAQERAIFYPVMKYDIFGVPNMITYALDHYKDLQHDYTEYSEEASRIYRIKKRATVTTETHLGLHQPLTVFASNPQRLLLSFRVRAIKAVNNVPVVVGCDRGVECETKIKVSENWQYHLIAFTADYSADIERYLKINFLDVFDVKDDWAEVADMCLICQSELSDYSDSTTVRMGNVKGIVDPIFGRLEGYGAYFQNLYATKNVNIAGTLTAGDERGFSSTFYVGRIHKNVIPDSINCSFLDTQPVECTDAVPTGIGKAWTLPKKANLIVQDPEWKVAHEGERYCFSVWMKSSAPITVSLLQDSSPMEYIKVYGNQWTRYHCSFIVYSGGLTPTTIIFSSNADGLDICCPQLEPGWTPSQYQPTDGTLSYIDDYGAWFSKGGIGGTIQNPLLKLNENGSISSRDGSFVINPDGTGYFSGGKFSWDKDNITLRDIILRWEDLDEQAKINLKGEPGADGKDGKDGIGQDGEKGDKGDQGDPGRDGVDANLLDWVKDWDSGKTVISSDTVITPKIFAGIRNANGTITGTAMGKFSLLSRGSSGQFQSEVIDGIYGFNDGLRTFAVDNTGSVEIGRSDQSIKYDSASGKVLFGVGVSLNWKQDIENSISNIQVGVRNYIKYSTFVQNNIADILVADGVSAAIDKVTKYQGYNTIKITQTSATGTNAGSARVYFSATKVCEPASFSMWVRSNINTNLRIRLGTNSVTDFPLTPEWRIIKLENKVPESKAIVFGATTVGAIFNIALPMLVEGTKVVDWHPSPDDLNYDVSVVKAVADAIVKQAGDENWSTKMTYIDKNGIFTGILSANTVNAIQINASQITAGTISVNRLDVATLKSQLITAANIEALKLNVTQGKIGGWSLDNDSIYRGTKNNTSGAFTASSGSITIGSNGIRGYKWNLDTSGAGKIAAGNIAWDALGNVTFGSSVSLHWKNDIEAAKSQNYGYPFYKKIVIYGDSDKYYPVIIKGGDQTVLRDILVKRRYTEQAPADWNTATHKGGLTLLLKVNFGGWGGTEYFWNIYELAEAYTNMFAGASYLGSYTMFCVFLRGGGETGALYHFYSDQKLDSLIYSPVGEVSQEAPQICYNSDLYFVSSTEYRYAPAPRTLTDAVKEEIRKKRFIQLSESSDKYLGQHPLTYIGSTGIYTGTLTANQVNAVNINATSIKTGTLSADRIAAGSIKADKLDAASIRSSIINTDYINGLSLNFVRGKVGGWEINTDSIFFGSSKSAGTSYALQIRGATSGSGAVYTNGLKPLGVTLTWHQTSNAGHLVFGQVMSNYSTVKDGFLGIQLMDHDSNEFFCISANTSKVGNRETYNRIAGWSFDHQTISKNNVSLGSDGSIVNGSKWKLNNDGSGSIASGNISWDIAGKVTLGSSVSFQWKQDIENAKSENYGYAFYKKIIVHGEIDKFYPIVIKGGDQSVLRSILVKRTNADQAPSDWYTETHKGNLTVLIKTNFGGWGGTKYLWNIYDLAEAHSRTFAGAAFCGYNMMFAIFLRGGGSTGAVYHIYSDQSLENTIYSPIGQVSQEVPQICYNSDLIMVSGDYKAFAPAPRTLTAGVEEEIRKKRFIELSESTDTYLGQHPLTYIGSTGIYTGTLTATQVNAVNINASSIKTGTLSVDRLTAGSIKAEKLDLNSVKASLITADNIQGLTLNFTKGKIGGWIIGSDNIVSVSSYAAGQTPLQIRSTSSGSGHVYTGAYKPFGITLSWYQSSNAGALIFGQVLASGNTVKTGFVGIQMMSWDHHEYFCLSANSVKAGAKETYNRIAGWAFDHQNITKNNVKLGADGSITNGNLWKLNNDGSGQIAGGNIVWNASGAVTFSSAVSLSWVTGINSASDLARAMSMGTMLYRAPEFYMNGDIHWNNTTAYLSNGTRSILKVADCPNSTGYAMRITVTGWHTATDLRAAGFTFVSCKSRANAIFIVRIIAKIPVGRKINNYHNAYGGGKTKWLTSQAGTGLWEEYICQVTCGASGTFATINHLALTGGTEPTAASPLIWDIGYATVIDITAAEKLNTTIDINGIYTGKISAGQINVDTALVVGGSSFDGSISVRTAADVAVVTLNRSGITATAGVIGSWTIDSDSIYRGTKSNTATTFTSASGSVTIGSNGIRGYKWNLDATGAGRLAGGNVSWTAAGVLTVTGTINATSGQIGGFTVASGRIGSTASGTSSSGGELAIYRDLIRVGTTASYTLLGGNTMPATVGGHSATARFTNTTSNKNYYLNNYGVYADVKNGYKNFGLWTNAAVLGTACIGIGSTYTGFTGTGYTWDFSQSNIFYVWASSYYSVTLPTESSVRSMFNYSSLPYGFAFVFTIIYEYNWANKIRVDNVVNNNGARINVDLAQGDVLTLLCTTHRGFHYQILNHMW